MSQFGWLAAEIAVGAAVTIAVHFTLFRPRPEVAVRRMRRSYAVRARDLASDMTELFEARVRSGKSQDGNQRAERQLQRQLLRLNEAALLIDAQLSTPAAIPAGWSAATLHQRLFDAEVGLGNDAAESIRGLLDNHDFERTGLTPNGRVVLHRFATSVAESAVALRAFRLYPDGQAPDDAADGEFTTPVATFGGWLPGSAFVAGAASQERGGSGLIERIRLAPYARISIQMGIAVGLAIIAGDALSGRRFYWAGIAAFITFMGANTAGEQIRKSTFRIAGTFVGVIVGAALAHLIGDRVLLQLVVCWSRSSSAST